MDTVAVNLIDIVKREVADYHTINHWQADTFFLEDPNKHIFVTLDSPHPEHPVNKLPAIIVMARVVADYVLIDEDITDKPLVKELVAAGIPREKIICVYAGEKIPDSILKTMQPTHALTSVVEE